MIDYFAHFRDQLLKHINNFMFQVRQEMRESTALGAAILAGLAEGVGVWNFSKSEEAFEVFHSKIDKIGNEKYIANFCPN